MRIFRTRFALIGIGALALSLSAAGLTPLPAPMRIRFTPEAGSR